MAEKSMFLVDIDKVVREKAGKKADRIPRFLISYLKRIVHQDEINAFLTRVADKTGVDFLEACVEYLDIRLEVEGIENLPAEGLCTFVSNPSAGRARRHRFGIYFGETLWRPHQILGQRSADEPAWVGTSLHSDQQDRVAVARFSGDGRGGIPFGRAYHHVPGRHLFAQAAWGNQGLAVEKDVCDQERGGASGCGACSLRRPEFQFFLQPCQRMQVSGDQVQHSHAVSGRRNV